MRLVLVLLLTAVVAADSQGPVAPQTPTFGVSTDLVRVDVTATFDSGAPVTDLQAADFEVTEDGVPQTVQTTKFVRVDGTRTSDLDEPLEIRSIEHARLEAARDDVRLFAIFLDDYHIDRRPDITLPLRATLAKFIRQLGPNDLVALMEPLTTLHDLQYTRSKADLLNRVRTFEGRRGQLLPIKSAIEEAQLAQRNWPELRAGVTLSALHALATQMGGLREGRKSILFFSQAPPLSLDNERRYREMIDAANRGNVTIHAIDPRGLGAGRNDDTLRRIAADTGGRAIINTNDPTDQLERVMAEASAYYLVGYTTTRRANDGKFHEIKVRVRRRGVHVTARRGYWAPTDAELNAAAATAAAPVNSALQGALSLLADSVNTRAVAMWTGISIGDGGRTRMTFTWEPNPGNTPAKPARLEIEPVDEAGTAMMPAQAIGGATGSLSLAASFDLPPGRQRVRLTSLTAAGDIVDRWVQIQAVPDLTEAPLVLATPRFLRARTTIELRAIEANPNAAPTASTRFGPTDRVLVELRAFSPSAAAPQIKVDLLDAKGGLLHALEVPPLVDGKVRMPLPVSSLASGTYVLRATAAADEASAEQWVAFRVAR